MSIYSVLFLGKTYENKSNLRKASETSELKITPFEEQRYSINNILLTTNPNSKKANSMLNNAILKSWLSVLSPRPATIKNYEYITKLLNIVKLLTCNKSTK